MASLLILLFLCYLITILFFFKIKFVYSFFGMAEKQNLCPKMTNFFYIIYYPFFYKKFPFLGQFFCLFCLSFLPFFYHHFFPLFFFICIFHPFVYKIQFCFFIILFPQLIEKKIIEKKLKSIEKLD